MARTRTRKPPQEPQDPQGDQNEGQDVMDVLSDQSVEMLEALADLGIYGLSPEEVAARFVDERLQELAGVPEFKFRAS